MKTRIMPPEEAVESAQSTRKEATHTPTSRITTGEDQNFPRNGKGRINFLTGASATCFFLAFFIFWFGSYISGSIQTSLYKFGSFAVLVFLGASLLSLGVHSTDTQKQVETSVHEKSKNLPSLGSHIQPLSMERFVTDESYGGERKEFARVHYDVRHPEAVVDSQC